MPWSCPNCGVHMLEPGEPLLGFVYRCCPVCRLHLVFNAGTNQLEPAHAPVAVEKNRNPDNIE